MFFYRGKGVTGVLLSTPEKRSPEISTTTPEEDSFLKCEKGLCMRRILHTVLTNSSEIKKGELMRSEANALSKERKGTGETLNKR